MNWTVFIIECVVMMAVFGCQVFGMLLFPNIKRVRLPGTEDMDKAYHQKWFHVKVMIPVIPVAVIGGAFMALLMTWIW